MDIACSLLCLRKFPTIQFRFLCILSGTLIKFIRLGTAVINLLDKLKRFRTELNFLQSQKTDILLTNVFLGICKQGASDLSWTLQPDAFFYLFLIHSVFVYLEAIKFVGTLILAISVESLWAKSGSPEYTTNPNSPSPSGFNNSKVFLVQKNTKTTPIQIQTHHHQPSLSLSPLLV